MYGDSGLLFGFRVIVLGVKAAIFGTQPQSQPQTQKQFLTQSQPPAPAPAPSPKRKFPNRAKRWTIKREPSSFGRKSADPDGSGVRVAWETKFRKPRRKAKLRV